jgi:hypothetical protein
MGSDRISQLKLFFLPLNNGAADIDEGLYADISNLLARQDLADTDSLNLVLAVFQTKSDGFDSTVSSADADHLNREIERIHLVTSQKLYRTYVRRTYVSYRMEEKLSMEI